MSYEMTLGLVVDDQEAYAEYRTQIRPLLLEAGGAFRYDFDVARLMHNEDGAAINRAFVVRFPDRSSKERFFADPRYLEVRRQFFEPAVAATVVIAEYLRDGASMLVDRLETERLDMPAVHGMAMAPARREGTRFWRFAAAAALVGGAIRVVTSSLTWDAGVWWLAALALVTDLGFLFGLMGVFFESHQQLAARLWIASTLTAGAAGAAGQLDLGFFVGGLLFGLGFVAAGLTLWKDVNRHYVPQQSERI